MRLIDADKVKEKICEELDSFGDAMDVAVIREIAIMKKIIDEQPTVDAEPIIRCKDCRHSIESKDYFDLDGVTPLCECHYMNQPQRWHEHCSWAIPKEEEEENK